MRRHSTGLLWIAAAFAALAGCSDSKADSTSGSERDAETEPIDPPREDAGANQTGDLDAGGADAGGADAGGADAGGADAGGADAGSNAPGPCTVNAPTACVEPAPVYGDVSSIFAQRCVVCHAGAPGGPWPLTSYAHVADWQNEIRDQVSRCTMPPPEAASGMSDVERDAILMWLRCGLKR